MSKQRRNHGQKLKRGALALVVEQGYSCEAAGRSLGMRGSLIGRWKRELEDNAAGLFPAKVSAQRGRDVLMSWKRKPPGADGERDLKKKAQPSL